MGELRAAAASFLEQIHVRTHSHEEAVQQLERATGTLSHEASALRAELQQFRFGDDA